MLSNCIFFRLFSVKGLGEGLNSGTFKFLIRSKAVCMSLRPYYQTESPALKYELFQYSQMAALKLKVHTASGLLTLDLFFSFFGFLAFF